MIKQNEISLPKAFVASIEKPVPRWERFSQELLQVLFRAWEDARERRHLEVAKQHLMMALLDDPQVKAHIKNAGFEIVKLESQVAHLFELLPTKSVPGEDVKWSNDLHVVLTQSCTDSDYHGQSSVDVWLVYDHLEKDELFNWIFKSGKKVRSDDHNEREQRIEKNYNLTKQEIRDLDRKLTASIAEFTRRFELHKADTENRLTKLERTTGRYGRYVEYLMKSDTNFATWIESEHALMPQRGQFKTRIHAKPNAKPQVDQPRRWYHWFRSTPHTIESPRGQMEREGRPVEPDRNDKSSTMSSGDFVNGAARGPDSVHPDVSTGPMPKIFETSSRST